MGCRTILFGMFYYALLLLNAASFAFEILKYLISSKIDHEDIPMNLTIVNIYLALTVVTLLKDVTFTCAIFRGAYNLYKPLERTMICLFFMLAWIVIPVIYTIILFRDLGKIPLLCPKTYNDMSKILNQACMIRIISFILMWSYTGIFGLSILFEITQEYSCHRNIDHDLEYEEKEQGIPFRPLSSTSEMQTRNGSKSKNEIPINEISINGSHNRSSNVPMSKSQPSPLSRPKPTHKNIFSPPSHEPK
ncbi:hypothetical protein F8M41_014370 [Gigaspora margarita]|uniref:Uncharacterized protein n=2 Tax=Gigaspora margarita TaxID=4874 RepID=A0A8H3WX79_GIGMA|nr:hypothetical protein F8M41_014370 [Gigaspora margarita]